MENSGVQLAAQTTHDGGQFYFNNSTVAQGLLYNHKYEIRMDTTQLAGLDIALAGTHPLSSSTQRHYSVSPANQTGFSNPDLRDSDAQLVGGSAIISVTSLDAGQNDFSNDLAIYACPELRADRDTVTLCPGVALDSISTMGTHLSQVDSVRFVVFSSPQSGTAMYGSGGQVLGTVKPDGTNHAVLNKPSVNTANKTAGYLNQYIYALVYPMPANPSCRQSSVTVLKLIPALSATATGGELTCSVSSVTLSGQAHYGDGLGSCRRGLQLGGSCWF